MKCSTVQYTLQYSIAHDSSAQHSTTQQSIVQYMYITAQQSIVQYMYSAAQHSKDMFLFGLAFTFSSLKDHIRRGYTPSGVGPIYQSSATWNQFKDLHGWESSMPLCQRQPPLCRCTSLDREILEVVLLQYYGINAKPETNHLHNMLSILRNGLYLPVYVHLQI